MDGAVRHSFMGNDDEPVLGSSMARSQTEDKEGKQRERKGGDGAHGGAVM
jgi:hypothetical protein